MLRQTLQQKQQLKLSPNQMLVQKLLLLPVASMEQRIKEEIENNPALEEGSGEAEEPKEETEVIAENDEGDNAKGKGDEDTETSLAQDYDAEEFMEENDEYVPAYKLAANNYSADEEKREATFADTSSFQDSLKFQLGMRNLNERQAMLADYILGNIDDDGYLRRDLYSISNDISFQQNILTGEKELMNILTIIQEFDPPGVGARNLQECLLIQLKRMPHKNETITLAMRILEKGFDEFSKKNYARLKEMMKTDEPALKAAIDEIIKLNPKPGAAYTDVQEVNENQIVPDFVITDSEGKPEVSLNGGTSSNLRLNPVYINMAERKKGMDKMKREAAAFARTKTEAAKGFIHAIMQREDTLQRVMQTILDFQQDFFVSGDEKKLKPMLLKDIAKTTGLDISTISRVVSSKYVQTNFGTFLLKKLFSEAFHKESGEDVSVNEVKNIVRELIEKEDKKKPINDEALVILLEQKGYKLARRTVAKYRETLGIPVARMRKEM